MSKKQLSKHFYTRAEVQPSTFNDEDRSVEVTFSTGARVFRRGFFTEDFFEELSMEPGHVDLSRFNNKAPLLNSHSQTDLSDVIGVVEDARLEGGVGVAKIRFSEREEVKSIVADVKAGILNHVSVGYRVHKYEKTEQEGEAPIYRAVDWLPMELSVVAIPADADANFRSDEQAYDCEVIENTRTEGNQDMTVENKDDAPQAVVETRAATPAPAAPVVEKVDVEAIRAEATKAEQKRASDIRDAVSKAGLESDVAVDLVNRNVNIDSARAEILDKLSAASEAAATSSAPAVTVGEDHSRAGRIEGMAGAILSRENSAAHKVEEVSRPYMYRTAFEMAEECVKASGVDTRLMSKDEIATRAFHTTSDFPLITENVMNKSLREGYDRTAQTFLPFVRRRSVQDFKQVSSVQKGPAPKLLPLLEDGEIQSGTIAEGAEKYAVESFARKVKLGRRLLINDDLGALVTIFADLGLMAVEKEHDKFWDDIIIANQLLADGFGLMSANHNNLGTAGAPSVAALSEARKLQRLHKDLDNETFIRITSRYLAVAPTDETLAEQLTTNVQGSAYSPDVIGNKNPFVGTITPLVEPRLEVAAGLQPWFVMAAASETPMVEWAVLAGQENGPKLSSYIDNDTKGMTFDILYDFTMHAVDYRGFVRNDGV